MPKKEIIQEINKVLDHFTDQSLNEFLSFLKKIEKEKSFNITMDMLEKIFQEDNELLKKLAQ